MSARAAAPSRRWRLLLALAACSTTNKPTPSPLEDIAKPQATERPAWNAQARRGVDFPLVVAVNGGVFTLAGNDGTVVALDADDRPRAVARRASATALAAGVGSDGRYAAVVTRDNELVALDARQAAVAHDARLARRHGAAGRRRARLRDGRATAPCMPSTRWTASKLWSRQRPGEALTLAQAGVAHRRTATRWSSGRARGWPASTRSRRAALGGAGRRRRAAPTRSSAWPTWSARRRASASIVCVRAFQSAVGCVDAERGTLAWSKNVGGNDGVAADAHYVFGADATDRITAWRLANGEVAWSNERFLHRGAQRRRWRSTRRWSSATARATCTSSSRDSGEPLLRLPTDGSADRRQRPRSSGTTLLVVTRNGGVYAFRPE